MQGSSLGKVLLLGRPDGHMLIGVLTGPYPAQAEPRQHPLPVKDKKSRVSWLVLKLDNSCRDQGCDYLDIKSSPILVITIIRFDFINEK